MGNGFVKNIKYIIECILSVIYDDSGKCTICGEPIEEEYICINCSSKMRDREVHHHITIENMLIECISAGYYSGIMKELILRLKYKGDFRCGKIIADILHKVIVKNNIFYDFITYVPSSKSSLQKRGYNQVEYIARLIAEKDNKKLLSCIKKQIETKDQIGLDGNDRWKNLKDSFKVDEISLINNSCILLIDDVITTGATAFYCSQALIKNGCGKVIILTAAKSKI
jgi:competence protein ComFC